MEQKDATLPEEGVNPDQQEQTDELELDENKEDSSESNKDSQGSDPLDDIEDVEEMRKEAKKLRAIANRKPKEEPKETPKEEPKETPKVEEGDYLKKSDFQLSNQKKAIRLATISSENDSEKAQEQKTDILDNWEEVRKYYSPRRGKDTPEDILEDIKDAYSVFNSRRPKVEEKEEGEVGKEEITKTETKTPTGNPPKTKEKAKDPKGFKLPKQPDEWYA